MTRNRPSDRALRTAYQLMNLHRPVNGGGCTCGQSRETPECRGARSYARAALKLAGITVLAEGGPPRGRPTR
ncbi:MAG: hypothetical protein AUI14_23270 [Actinobacteria bacterium 13_2_20CM_2_71_6]|nr:MAG: hypothetical protein AUI14_23270 [Actinobacteria bacterium 13_2_20CM_2_71_6]